jgi:hypothetical protein
MFLTALVLVSIDSEHHSLEECVDFAHGNKAAEMRDVSGLGLEQKEQISVFLRLFVVGEKALLQFGGIVKMAGHFVLLVCIVNTRFRV